jgi:hypothetical protein
VTELAKLTDAQLEELFLEAERNALQWSELAIGIHADHRAVRWMEIAASYQAEITRRARNPSPPPRRKKRR